MEHAQGEQNGLEFVDLGGFIDKFLREFGVSSSQVGFQILGSLIGDLDGVLQDRLGDNVHVGEWGRLRGNEATEAFLGDFGGVLQVPLEQNGPFLHEMQVLEHDPGSLNSSSVDGLFGSLLLTLTHGNVDEFAVVR
jgi:hypothetical protein